jgi:hypothetical protein
VAIRSPPSLKNATVCPMDPAPDVLGSTPEVPDVLGAPACHDV